jgi:hypothetical protein
VALYSPVTRERIEREGSKKHEFDSMEDEWVGLKQVTDSDSEDEAEAITVRTPLQ